MVMEEDLTLGDKSTMKYTNDVLQNFKLETYVILLISVIPTNLIIKIGSIVIII